jgi:branched-chain amino acid aminotransferase
VIIAAFPWGHTSAQKRGSGDRRDGFPGTALHRTPSRRRQKPVVTTFFLLVGSEARRHGYQEGIALDVNGYISRCG